ncbi:MAG TPA: serine/threonine protein kinase [Candidatus Hydrogenedentes bacterium]|nr:serine/threonine protein kinase [Candidatus Hydrogenedentota bacterium]
MAKKTCSQCLAENAPDATHCVECGASLAEPPKDSPEQGNPDDFKPGDIINDRYTVIKLIGRGGMGSIYKVHDRVLDEDLAFKVLLPYFAAEQEVVDRFINEVRITRKIAHPNIVRVHDFGTMGERMFISMEYVDGESLRDKLDKLKKGERLPLRQSLHIISQLCIALKYAHHFTIHRDIKPDNIMITRGNNIKLMDFGISKLHDKRHETKDSSVVGTPYYMAPEQMCNLPDIDSRADIYSVGVVMYELLTGSLPGNIPQPISQLNDETPLELDAVVMKCLAPERDKRYNNASELREALRPIIEGLHFSSSSGGISSKDSKGDGGSIETPALNVFSDAMQAFMRESQDGGAAAQPDTAFIRKISSSDSDVEDAPLPSVALQDFNFEKPKTAAPTQKTPVKEKSVFGLDFINSRVIIAIVIVLGIIIIFFTRNHMFSRIEEYLYTDTEVNPIITTGSVEELLSSGLSVTEIYLAALDRYRFDKSPEQKKRVDELREYVLADIEKRAYSRPFDLDLLTSASSDLARISERDSDPRIIQLRETLNREVNYFRFVLMKIDRDEDTATATFRLNNAFFPEETQTVAVGDLLQNRFLVHSITHRTVILVDQSEKGKGRGLIARPMEVIEAEVF